MDTIIAALKRRGWSFCFPPGDTASDDEDGSRTFARTRAAIEAAEMVFVMWDDKSQAGLFALGMAYALRKPITVLAPPPATEWKSYQNMMREWAEKG